MANKLKKAHLLDYALLAAKLWLVYILVDYGWGKLSSQQFGISQSELNTPVKDLSLFKLSWYLADHQPFKAFIGISQIITALLLFFRRTTIIGALMSIPIWLNILVWDMTFIGTGSAFTIRISWYLLLTFTIIWHHRERFLPAFQKSIAPSVPKFKYPLWAWILLPFAAIGIEIIIGLPVLICNWMR